MWLPTTDLSGDTGPKYKALVEAIITDIESGRLRHDVRMPTHRDLAYHLKVSVQTVSAAYKEVERQGYLRSERRRGTFVQARLTDRASSFILDNRQPDLIDLSIVRSAYTDFHNDLSRQLHRRLADDPHHPWMESCRPVAGFDYHREVGVKWLAGMGLAAEPSHTIITNGAAQGIFIALASIVQPDDVVLTESLTDHGVIGTASVLRFKLGALPTDDEGIIPEAFERECQQRAIRALVITPIYTNPTNCLMGLERRKRIAEIASQHGVYVIEDDVYRPLLEQSLPPITSFIPQLGFHVSSLTKIVMPGLRTGYLVVPKHLSIRASSVLRVTGWMGTPLIAEIGARWIEDGVVAQAVTVQRALMRERQSLVAEILGDAVVRHHPTSLSAWVRIPEHWQEEWFASELRKNGVAVTISDPFMTVKVKRPNAIRVCVGGAIDTPSLHRGLMQIRHTMEQMPGVHAFDVMY
ncbi:PLP-dependent aminotransferase family protein [Thalassospira marina]|uniref:GntR family transcriptional regulator n=1 Tax=Thalassospira marina TaxID=2048283 RepID=A0A2N3KYY1_9PROT|nr:PLP-dependent aminotransferase family protein [Thalassospira marina]AUG51771.1 GntR family transcriptional regulator [Thalassospira marina]PKR55700.1 GntR family transcriptional regulator [Thalassospira marina]